MPLATCKVVASDIMIMVDHDVVDVVDVVDVERLIMMMVASSRDA